MVSRLRHAVATSDAAWASAAREVRRHLASPSVPWPRAITVPYRVVFTTLRGLVHFVRRVFIAEPIFRSYCARIGRRFRTDIYIHWVQGAGRIEIGDDVLLDGKSSFAFAARFTDRPLLRIGDRTGIGHGCTIVVAREICIGADCRIASGVTLRDSPGHPVEPEARRRGEPPPIDAVKPIVIEDNVWIGSRAIIQAGIRIGSGSVVANGAVVMSDVPPNTLVAGNPARRIATTPAAQAAEVKERA